MRIVYPTYYEESVDTAYPFESFATRTNGSITIEDDIFVDGRFFPPDGRNDLFLSSIIVAEETTLIVSDPNGEVGRGYFDRSAPPEYVTFYAEGRGEIYIGLLQGSFARDELTDPIPRGLSKIAGWPTGTYNFTSDQTRFAATVVVPQPQETVRSIRLDSGAIFYGDVVLVGENGVQFTNPSAINFFNSSSSGSDDVIQMDIVGDPLFSRRGCESADVVTDQDLVLEAIVFSDVLLLSSSAFGSGTTKILPDDRGGFTILVGTESGNEQPALRVLPIQNGLEVSFISG